MNKKITAKELAAIIREERTKSDPVKFSKFIIECDDKFGKSLVTRAYKLSTSR